MRPGTVHATDVGHHLRKLNAVGVAGRSFVLPHQQLDATAFMRLGTTPGGLGRTHARTAA